MGIDFGKNTAKPVTMKLDSRRVYAMIANDIRLEKENRRLKKILRACARMLKE